MKENKIKFYLNLAKEIAKQSTCQRGQVGAIIVQKDCIASTGWNGAARGVQECYDKICKNTEHCKNTQHAESNAIVQAARLGVSIEGAIMFCTHKPCNYCSGMILNVGIKEVYYKKDYEGEVNHIDLSKFIKTVCIK